MGYPIPMLSLLTTILSLLLFSLQAHAEVCAPGQWGTVEHGSFLYQCANGEHKGPTACVTEFNERDDYKIIRKNGRGLYYPEQVTNCQAHELLQVTCILSPDQAPIHTCIDPKARDCVSPKGVKLPIGTGIEEDGQQYFCAIRHYEYRAKDKWKDIDFAFLFDCRYDQEDYQRAYKFLKSDKRMGYMTHVWNHFCDKQKPKFILPITTSFEFLSQIECTYYGHETKNHADRRTIATIPFETWKIIHREFNVSCKAGQTTIENCMSGKGTPIPFGGSIIETDYDETYKYTCEKDPIFLKVEEVITNSTSIDARANQ